MLIAHAGRILSIKLQASKEWGVRPVELFKLKVKDIDLEQQSLRHNSQTWSKPHNTNNKQPNRKTQKYIYKYRKHQNDQLFLGNETDTAKNTEHSETA